MPGIVSLTSQKEMSIVKDNMEANLGNSSSIIPKKNLIPFILLVSCFALWGLLNNMTDNLVPSFAKIFMIDAVESSKVQIAFYGAYAVLAIPAALIIKKYSYRAGLLVGLGFYMLGAFGYIPAAMMQSYELFLISIFVLACGLSVLETTCNPFVIALGSEETSVRRLNFAQAFNPVGSLTGIFLAKYLILSHLNPAGVAERHSMAPEQLAEIRDTELFWVCTPYVGLIVVAALIWLFFFCRKDLAEQKEEGAGLEFVKSLKTLCSLPRYYWGVITQFFYVGVQITVWTWTIKYAMAVFPGMQEATAADYYLYAILLFIACRWVCTALMKVFNPASMMAIFAAAALLCCFGTIYLPANYSIWTLVGISGCMSLMFPTIYGIALRGLGSALKLGAAGLIMAILGGAVITPIMGWVIDSQKVSREVRYFEERLNPYMTQLESLDANRSISSKMVAVYRMSTDEDKETQLAYSRALATFKQLSTKAVNDEEFINAIHTLPSCAHVTSEGAQRIRENLKRLPAEMSDFQVARYLPMLPAFAELNADQTELLDQLINMPAMDMETFKGKNQKFAEESIRTSFYIPVFCFLVVLLYSLAFQKVHLKDEELA
jgi:FHS family L-fucose permease-like MFS transporter